MKRILAIVVLIAVTFLLLPKDFFHDHEKGHCDENVVHVDDDCYVCDLDLGIFEATIGIVLSVGIIRFTTFFLHFEDHQIPVFVPASTSRGPPAFS